MVIVAKNGASIPTLFLIPGQGGSTFNLIKLGRLVNCDVRIIALPPKGLRRNDEPHITMEEVVEYYVSTIYRYQARGPYLLFGYSLGGVIAFAVAERLIQSNKEVGLLALVDSYPDSKTWPILTKLSVVCQRSKYRLDWLARARFIDRIAFVYWFATQRWRSSYEPFSASMSTDIRRELFLIDAVGRAQVKAVSTYRPNFCYPGKVLFFQPRQRHPGLPRQPKSVWGRHAASIEIFVVPGDHNTLFEGPSLTQLAHTLSVQIEESLAILT